MAAVVALAVLLVLNGSEDGPAEPSTPTTTVGGELRQTVHWHADLALYIRGERYSFDQERFYSTAEEELSENVHIHRPWDVVVHVHRESSTWREFFDSLGFELTDACITLPAGERFCNSETERLTFILNGVKVDALAFEDITNIDRVLISFGNESDEELMQRFAEVTSEACILSGLCDERVPEGGIPDEACGGVVCN
jgi:methionine synthase II (cobalamin-independent)